MRKIYISLTALLLVMAMALFVLPSCSHRAENESEEEENDEYDSPQKAAEFEFNRMKDPSTGKLSTEKLWDAVLQTERLKQQLPQSPTGISSLNWIERGSNADAVGPSNGNTRPGNGATSGRIRAVWVDLADATNKTVWVGGVDGGLWKTTDISAAPATWTPVNDYLSNLAISGITQNPADPNVMYFCTGESWIAGDGVGGVGVFKSTDHGVTWNLLPSTTTFKSCTKILCDASGNVYCGTLGISVALGLQRSTDGGTTWTSINPSTVTSRIPDFEISSTGTMHVVAGYGTTASTYFFTTNPAAATPVWQTATTPYTPPTANGRVELTTNGNTVYAAISSNNVITSIAKSTDGGLNYVTTTLTATNQTDLGSQATYDLGLGVDPSNANNVMVGGLRTLKSTDGGLTFTKISEWVGNTGQYVHADIHSITWFDNGNKVLISSDGGMFYTNDKGVTFTDRNVGLRLKQFYGVAIHPSTTNYFLCGAQDNGTHQFNNPGLSSSIEVTGGDGGITGIDQDEPQFQAATYVGASFRRSQDGGATWFTNTNNTGVGQFIDPYDYDNVGNKIYAGGNANQILRWENPHSGFTITTVALTTLAGGSVASVAVSPYTTNRVYVGTTGGLVIRLDNANATPTETNITPAGMTGYVNAVVEGTSDQNIIAISSNTGINNIYSTTNGGTSWTACDGNLPDMPVYWALYNPDDNNKAYIATETGVWSTDLLNGASTVWVPESTFPTVKTQMLKYRPSDRTIAAATHGRGLWTTTLPNASCTPASITTPPSNVTVCAGATASFTVVADGTAPLSYKWQVSVAAGPFTDIPGATSATYSFTTTAGQNGNQYRAVVTGNCAPLSATSATATLTVNPVPVISSQPVNTTVCVGANATFSVTATGVTSYQWQVSTGGGPFTNIPVGAPYSGTTTATLTITGVTAGMNNNQYRVVLNTACSVTSNAATLFVTSGIAISTHPQPVTVCAGANAVFNVTATGAGLTYVWESATAIGGPYTPVVGAPSSPTLTLTAVTTAMNGNYYHVIVSGSCGAPVTSNPALLTVNAVPVITGQPQNATICAGANASFSVTATGATTYQWQVSTGGGPFNNIPAGAPYSGETTATLTITAATTGLNGNQYRVVLNNATCPVTSNAATLTVNGLPAITTAPQPTTVCSGSNATFTVVATGAGLTYSWETATALAGPYTPVVGAPSSPTLTLTAVTPAMNGNYYRVVVSGTCPPPVTSAGALLTVNTQAVITAQPPATVTVCEGSNATISVTATGASSYQWQVSTGGGPFANVPAAAPYSGTTTATLTITAATFALNNNQYRVITNPATCPVTSSATTLVVNTLPVITVQPQPVTLCSGTNATFSVTATGTGLTYQWQQATALAGPYTAVVGAPSSPTLTLTAVTPAMNGNYYRVVVSGTCTPPVTSNGVLLTVNTVAVINTQPVSTTACFSASGTNTSFFVGATGTGLAYQWQYSTDGGNTFANVPNAAPYSGVNAATLNITGVTLAMNNYQFRVLVTSTCTPTGTMSAVATLTVINPVTINSAPVPFVGCVGNTATFTVAATGTGLTYQWQLSSDGITYGNVPNQAPYSGVNSPTLTVTNIQLYQNNYRFRVIVNATPCGSVTTTGVVLTVNGTPSVVLTGASYTSINPSVPAQLYTTVSPLGTYIYQYRKNGVVVPGLTTQVVPLNVDMYGTYTVTVTNAATGCSATSNSITVKDSISGRVFIYPNPNKGKFQVRYYNSSSTATVRSINVFDNKGARVYYHQFPTTAIYERMDVDLSNYAAGIYVVEVMDADGKRLATGTVKKD